MFVASSTLPAQVVRPRHARATGSTLVHRPSPFALRAALCWLAIGGCALALLPHSRSGADLGATLPFWLVGAPLIDLAWLMRGRGTRVLVRAASGARRLAARQRFGARRVPATPSRGSASCHARRSNIS
jgi:hypothetical protein